MGHVVQLKRMGFVGQEAVVCVEQRLRGGHALNGHISETDLRGDQNIRRHDGSMADNRKLRLVTPLKDIHQPWRRRRWRGVIHLPNTTDGPAVWQLFGNHPTSGFVAKLQTITSCFFIPRRAGDRH